jgi:hypothetical protein
MYVKLFPSMFEGTLVAKGPWQAIVTFSMMLMLCDETGEIDWTPEAIANKTTIPLDIIRTGIEALEQPDPDSRNPELEGRRIVRLADHRSWGWRIVNYQHYRNLRNKEERREYQREYQQNRRDSRKQLLTGVNNRHQSSSKSTQAVSSKKKQEERSSSTLVAPPAESPTDEGRKQGNGSTPATKVGQRLPADWRLPDEWKQWVVDVYGLEPQKVVRMSLEFRDYWVAVPGSRGRKLDWLATWRNNVRKKMGDA